MRQEITLYGQTAPLQTDANGNLKVALLGFTDVTAFFAAAANIADRVLYIAPAACIVQSVQVVWATAETTADPLTFQISKDTATDAPGAGTDLLGAALSLKTTANTVAKPALITTTASLTLAEGDRLAIDFASTGTITEIAGLLVTIRVRHL